MGSELMVVPPKWGVASVVVMAKRNGWVVEVISEQEPGRHDYFHETQAVVFRHDEGPKLMAFLAKVLEPGWGVS